ncbi:MAG: hypothetical protein AAB015_04395, partial [Nitrospirota bacterium]
IKLDILCSLLQGYLISVMPTCSASFFKKDSRQAGMTIKNDSTFRYPAAYCREVHLENSYAQLQEDK